VSERHLLNEISRRFKKMDRSTRVSKIRKMALESESDASFVKEAFPDLYSEAFGSSVPSGDAGSGLGQPCALSAKRR
jgi:hypothetical protein